ncbi:acyl-CoA dehydrogenase family protein [Nocardia jinanensis]|uniref:Acyl-CoA dehydrogenase n=1 Tax=Nocardia jinanensis TaxID=382504 RepID=A0A917RY92_9NOCA|nr:acyl-CoA dehydrogenase family protein [Nocardia jinanensis]GGL41817.1 acyl-CoA dehydrogenase [Nocardia jinanensis]
MRRTLFDEDHEVFRETVRRFLHTRAVPRYAEWETAGHPDREFWLEAGELGLLGTQIPEEFGGGGETSFLYNVVLTEEAQRAGLALGGLRVHTDICMPYFLDLATRAQQARWLPRLATGEAIAALAMSEPGAGSDVKAMATHAVRDGDHYIVNGAKTFITNGRTADLIVLAVKTDPAAGRRGISLLVVDAATEGFVRGRKLDKLGLKSQDLAELSFTDMRVPVANLLGEEGQGFTYLTRNLAQERLSIAVNSQAAASHAVETTVEYVSTRQAFGTTVGSFQNTKFELAACAADVEAGQSLLDRALLAHEAGDLGPADAAKVKLFCTELQGRVVDRCLQLYGGYGYILEYPIAKAYADARVTRIYAGSSEIMKTIIAKDLGL